MCGIVGFSGPKDRSLNADKIKLLLFYNQERGKDSLGFYTPKEGIYKEIGKPEEQMMKASFSIPESNLFIGHVRAATVGDVNKNNAHPFKYDNIVLLMNGTLTNHWALAREYELIQKDFEVDTQVLAAIISKTQSKDVLGKVFGGCAVLYVDTKTEKMYAFTNGQRPLFRGTLNGCMYISSIENSLKLIGCLDVKSFKDNYFYEIDNGRIMHQMLIKPPKDLNEIGPVCYDAINKFAFITLQLYSLKYEELKKLWLSPDSSMPSDHLRVGFSYKVVDALEDCTEHQVTVINDKGVAINIYKSRFMYKTPIISAGSQAFCTAKLSYKPDTNGVKAVFAEAGDLLIAKERTSPTEWYCYNINNMQSGNVSLKHLRFGMKNEVEEYFDINFLNNNDEEDTDTKNRQTKLPLEGNNADNGEDELSAYLSKWKKELESTDLADDFESHSSFCMDNIEDILADIDEMPITNLKLKEKLSCLKFVAEYYQKHLGAYFEMEESFEEKDDNEETIVMTN